MLPVTLRLPVKMLPQPDEVTCGPTCLQAIYRYWGEDESLEAVISRARRLDHGGTLAVFLACDALRKGYAATIYTYNLTFFDPTWFRGQTDLIAKLEAQSREKRGLGFRRLTEGYAEFVALGGKLRLTDLSRTLVRGLIRRRLPILTGLSSTFLYRAAREFGPDDRPDDVRGVPAGHFVVLAGYHRRKRSVLIVDPYEPHPYGTQRGYWINIDRVMGAILLGIVTHDANLLVIYPNQAELRLPASE
jgi:hypothetical protein